MRLGGFLCVCALTGVLFQPAVAQQRTYSVSGAANIGNATGFDDPYIVLRRPDVQAIVTQALNGPIAADQLVSMLKSSDVKLEHLVATSTLEPTADGKYRLGTTVLTVADRRLIDRVSDPMGRSLAEAFLKERAVFDRILSRYDLPDVDPAMVRMALIGCVIMDWDGLGVTGEGQYRTLPVLRPNGARYQMVLRENGPGISESALYWGSHSNEVAGKTIWTTTFGDHHFGTERVAFPDLTWVIGDADFTQQVPQVSSRVTKEKVGSALAAAFASKMEETQDSVGLIMIALRNGPADAAALSAVAKQSPERTKEVLNLLEAIQYVGQKDGRYHAAIPVFTAGRDSEMIKAYRDLGKDIMRRWLRANYSSFQNQLSGLASLRAGVPFKTMFTELWHPIFGWANYHLVKQGYLYDPYGPGTKFVSFVPFVWDAPLKMEEGTKIFD